MSNKKNDITEVEKYLKGTLNNQAMYRVESEAQDDPFFMEALEGYETAADIAPGMADLKQRLARRIASKKQRNLLLWRVLPMAACLLLMIGAAWWFIVQKLEKPEPDRLVANPITKMAAPVVVLAKPAGVPPTKPSIIKPIIAETIAKKLVPAAADKIVYQTDTVEYKAQPDKLADNSKHAKIDDILKKMKGLQVDSSGNILAANGQPVTRERLNGKEYLGGSVQQAVKNLPADIVQKVQIIDDYGNQASKKRLDTALTAIADNPVGNTPVLLQGRGEGLIIQNYTGLPNKKLNTYKVTGKVTNIYGAALKNTWIGTRTKLLAQTDTNGFFKTAVPVDSELFVKTPGYLPKSVKIDRPSDLYVTLAPPLNRLAEVSITKASPAPKEATKAVENLTTGATYVVIPCQENIKFKTKFLANIAIAERYVSEHAGGYASTVSDKKFLRVLKIIAKQTHCFNTPPAGFKDLETFAGDKKCWMEWYQENKCRLK